MAFETSIACLRGDSHIKLVAEDLPEIKGNLSGLYMTAETAELREFEIKFDRAEFAKLRDGATYRLVPVNANGKYRWVVADDIRITKSPPAPVKGR